MQTNHHHMRQPKPYEHSKRGIGVYGGVIIREKPHEV